MLRRLVLLVVMGVAGVAVAAADDGPLDVLRRAAGWRLLFDGETFAGWRSVGSGAEPGPGWVVEDGCLHLAAGGTGGDLVSDRTYRDFELELEWKVTPGGNGGVKYRVPPIPPGKRAVGPEFQVLDDAAHPDGLRGETSAGALYGLFAPERETSARPGVFHHARILVRGNRIEHWLDGERLLVARVGEEDWARRLADSKFAAVEGFGAGSGHIVLQDHGDELWLRSIVLRDLGALPGESVSLDAGPGLTGWRRIGDARYVGEGDTILGEVDGGGQSFLVTERAFGDFVLEVDVRTELPGNSGIQVRSHQDPATARLVGYQIEIDPSERAWSGGLYDEARRGWLDDLDGDDAARAAYRHQAWNHYRIECIGPSLRAWVNGVPTADHLDVADLEGVIGLQVHSGNDTRVRWRELRLQDLGRHAWRPRPLDDDRSWTRSATGEARWSPDGAGIVCRGGGVGRLTLGEPLADVGLSVSFEGTGELVLRMRPEGDEAAPVLLEPPASGLRHEASGGWTVHPAVETGGPHVLTVCAYGARLAIDLDGRRLVSADDVQGRGGRLVLDAHVPGDAWLRVTEVALLERRAR